MTKRKQGRWQHHPNQRRLKPRRQLLLHIPAKDNFFGADLNKHEDQRKRQQNHPLTKRHIGHKRGAKVPRWQQKGDRADYHQDPHNRDKLRHGKVDRPDQPRHGPPVNKPRHHGNANNHQAKAAQQQKHGHRRFASQQIFIKTAVFWPEDVKQRAEKQVIEQQIDGRRHKEANKQLPDRGRS